MAHTLDYKNSPPKYKDYQGRANKRFPNDVMITEKQFDGIAKQSCHYCGKKGPNGIDRIINDTGYTLENCVSCCKHCNYVKGDLSLSDFQAWVKRFVAKQLKIVKQRKCTNTDG